MRSPAPAYPSKISSQRYSSRRGPVRFRSFTVWMLAALALGISMTACGGGGGADRSLLASVPHPDLQAVETAARQQLEEAKEKLERALEDRRSAPRDLANAYGGLGELYQVYDLPAAAAVCYDNARRLDTESFVWPYLSGLLASVEGNPERALEAFGVALEQRPESSVTQLRLGQIHLGLGDGMAASPYLKAAVQDPKLAEAARYGLGRAAVLAGEDERAVDLFEQVLEAQPEAGLVRHPLALALRRLGRGAEAEALLAAGARGAVAFPDRLEERLDRLPQSSGAFFRRGNRALMAGDLPQAEVALREAVRIRPAFEEAQRNLALVLTRLGRPEDAVRVLREALGTAPDNVWLHYDLGTVHLAAGRPEAALEAFGAAVERAPGFEDAHFNLGNILAGLERWREAKVHLDRVLELDPGERRAQYLSAMATHSLGNSAAAVGELEALLDIDPAFTVARQGLGQILAATGSPDRAIATYAAGLDFDLPTEQKVQLLSSLAELEWARGRRNASIDRYRKAAELDPTSSTVQMNLANVLQLNQRSDEALVAFARAVELDSKNTKAWQAEASLWIVEGRYAEARDRLEAALVANPDHPGLSHTLARLLATCPLAEVRNGQRALALARSAYALENNLDHAETVAMAMAELGLFEQAVQWQRSLAGQAVGRGGDRQLMRRLAGRLRKYENRQPERIQGGETR